MKALPYEKLAVEVMKVTSLEDMASVYQTHRGMDIGFRERSLMEFARKAPGSWGLESGDISTTVVMSPHLAQAM